SFVDRESLELIVNRGGALGGLRRVLHCSFPSSVSFDVWSPINLREEQRNPSSFSNTTPFLVWDFSTYPASSSTRFCAFHHQLRLFPLNAYLRLLLRHQPCFLG